MSESEYQAKRDKGLCFRCDEKFTRGHKCKLKELNVMLTHDCESEEDEIQEAEVGEQVTMQSAEVVEDVELSLNSIIGFTSSGTMKIKGSIGKQAVVVLIDCGATHNFIAQRLVDELKLPITVTKNYGVILGLGRAVKGKGVCKAVAIRVADIIIVENFSGEFD